MGFLLGDFVLLLGQFCGDLLLHGYRFERLVGGADQVGEQTGFGRVYADALPARWNFWGDFQRIERFCVEL